MLASKKTLLFIISLVFLQACSGGGGGEDSSGGSGGSGGSFSIDVDESRAHFTNPYQGSPSGTKVINVTYSGGGGFILSYAPGSTNAPWLDFSESKTSTTATITMDVIDSDTYPAGLYTTKLRAATGTNASNSVFKDITVSMLVAKKVSFNGVIGNTDIAPQTSTIISSTADSWTISDNADWVDTNLVVTSGAIQLTSAVVPTALSENTFSTNATLTNTSTDETYLIPIEIGLENAYVFANQAALSFVKTENISRIATTLNISSNTGNILPWTSTDNADWLTLTPTSIDVDTGLPTQVIVSVDISPEIENKLSQAVVTIAAPDATSYNIPVSFFHSDEELTPFNINTTGLNINSNAVVISPSSADIYVGSDNKINIYNQYDGTMPPNTITVSPEGSVLSNFVIHPKGDILIAQTNGSNYPSTVTRYKIDLTDNSVTDITTTSEISSDPHVYTTVAGRHFIITEAIEFADENLALLNTQSNIPFVPSSISIAKDTNTIFAVNDTNSTVNRFTMSVNDATADKVTTFLTDTSPSLDSPILDIAVTSDEQSVYIVNESSEWLTFNNGTFTDNGLLDTDSKLLVINGNDDVPSLYEPSSGEISTHNVYIDSDNLPHFIRTIAFTPNSTIESYETYSYEYAPIRKVNNTIVHPLLTRAFVESSEAMPTEGTFELAFTASNEHMVMFNPSLNFIKLTATPFNQGTVILEHAQLSTVIFKRVLDSIGTIWSHYEFGETPWITLNTDVDDPQGFSVTLTPDLENLATGFYERKIYLYDKINKVTSIITVELTIP